MRVPRMEIRVPRISENCHRVSRIIENRVPRIGEIGFLQVHTGYLTFSLKKPAILSKLMNIMKLGTDKLCDLSQGFLRKMLGTRYGPVVTRFLLF